MMTFMQIEDRLNRLKKARTENATRIKDLEEQNEVINVEMEKLLVEKGKVMASENMRRYFED